MLLWNEIRLSSVELQKAKEESVKRKALLSCAAGAMLAAATFAPALTGQQPPQPPQERRPEVAKTHLKVGDIAPDFTLPSTTGGRVTLSDHRGKQNVILAFYVLAFTGG